MSEPPKKKKGSLYFVETQTFSQTLDRVKILKLIEIDGWKCSSFHSELFA